MSQEQADLTGRVGPVEVDWPRTAGYFSGIALAVAFGVVEPPLGLFIAAVPFFKLLNQPSAPRPLRVATHFLDGMAKPVGGEAEATFWLAEGGERRRPGILSEARDVADQYRTRQRRAPDVAAGR